MFYSKKKFSFFLFVAQIKFPFSPSERPVGVRGYDKPVGEAAPVTVTRDVHVIHVGCRDLLANLGDQVQDELHVVRLALRLGGSEQ